MQVPDLESRYRVPPGRFRLAEHDPADTAGLDSERSCSLRGEDLERLRLLQKRLYAERRQSLLVVLQGLDASGKDGIVAHVMSGVDPSALRAMAFKRPSPPELAHDWLWRCVLALPGRGQIGVFNRSHYEEVIAVRVHPEQLAAEAVSPERARDEQFWKARMKTIEAWERHLVSCRTRVVKRSRRSSSITSSGWIRAIPSPTRRRGWRRPRRSGCSRPRADAADSQTAARVKQSAKSCPWGPMLDGQLVLEVP